MSNTSNSPDLASQLIQRTGDLRKSYDELTNLIRDNAESPLDMSSLEERLAGDLAVHNTHYEQYSQALLNLRRNRDGITWMKSLFRTFPSEILREIFGFVVSPGVVVIGGPKPIPHLQLAQVCARWRLEILSYADLWQSVTWNLGSGVAPESLLEAILPLSKSLPLSIRIIAKPGSKIDIPRVVPAMKSLISHSSRWKSVEINMPCAIFRSLSHTGCFAALQGQIPILHKLNLDIDSTDDDEDHTLPPVEIFTQCPALREVSLSNRIASQSSISLPWDQLETLKLSNASRRAVHSMSLAAKHLKRLSFLDKYSTVAHLPNVTFTPDPNTVHEIEILDLTVLALERQLAFIDALTLPHLHFLAVGCNGGSWHPSYPFFRLTNLVQRSGAALRTLTLCDIPISLDELIGFFKVVPSLETLNILRQLTSINSAAILGEGLFKALTLPETDEGEYEVDESNTLLPHLQRIEFTSFIDSTDAAFPYDAFIDLVSSRYDYSDEFLAQNLELDLTSEMAQGLPFAWFGIGGIQLTLNHPDGFSEDHCEEIERLRKDGLEFVIGTGDEFIKRFMMEAGVESLGALSSS